MESVVVKSSDEVKTGIYYSKRDDRFQLRKYPEPLIKIKAKNPALLDYSGDNLLKTFQSLIAEKVGIEMSYFTFVFFCSVETGMILIYGKSDNKGVNAWFTQIGWLDPTFQEDDDLVLNKN